jgi:hypothetical protein
VLIGTPKIGASQNSVVLRASDGMFDHVVGDIAHIIIVTASDLPEPLV